MFEQLLETKPQTAEFKSRNGYFIISSVVLCSALFGALIFSLFAIDLNLVMGDFDTLELIAPVDVTEQKKLPEMEIAPKMQPKGGQTASRQVNMARIDESPREAPTTVSTAQNNVKARPSTDRFEIGKLDTDQTAGSGSGRGDGTGDGTGLGDGDGEETLAAVSVNAPPPPPPPVKKEPVKEKPVIKNMGVVNSIAISLPLPAIPAAARTANAAGTVSVKVLVDEDGNVISANAVSGNILLRSSSEAAARNARFTPTKLSGQPIKISGVIHYHFSG